MADFVDIVGRRTLDQVIEWSALRFAALRQEIAEGHHAAVGEQDEDLALTPARDPARARRAA